MQFLKAMDPGELKRIYKQSIEQLKRVCYNIVRGQGKNKQ